MAGIAVMLFALSRGPKLQSYALFDEIAVSSGRAQLT
jgi:hypothetical protein